MWFDKVVTKLLGLPGPIKDRHAVNTILNLLTRAKMARSLIDMGGTTTLEPQSNHSPLPTLPIQVLHFPLFTPPSHTNNINIKHVPMFFQNITSVKMGGPTDV
jgi:hypothetical protein